MSTICLLLYNIIHRNIETIIIRNIVLDGGKVDLTNMLIWKINKFSRLCPLQSACCLRNLEKNRWNCYQNQKPLGLKSSNINELYRIHVYCIQ